MEVTSAHSLERDVPQAVSELRAQIAGGLEGPPDLLIVYPSVTFGLEALRAALAAEFPTARLHGGSSCLGAMTEQGFHSEGGHGVGVLAIRDPHGAYGTAMRPLGGDPAVLAAEATSAAMADARRPGEMPIAVLVTATPGQEEEVIRGIERAAGAHVPILGGSAADNAVEGRWEVFDRCTTATSAMLITALYPSVDVSYSFHSGYSPTALRGRVTSAEGRLVRAIDGEPAAVVYARWLDGGIDDALEGGASVLARTTLYPLGRVAGSIEGSAYYQLSHPERITADHALAQFATVGEGDELVLMRGTPDSLVDRAARVARAALGASDAEPGDVIGGIVVYCAGCMLTVQDRMDEVVAGLQRALPARPFVGTFTFGEQGCFPSGENKHGNLMISALLFVG